MFTYENTTPTVHHTPNLSVHYHRLWLSDSNDDWVAGLLSYVNGVVNINGLPIKNGVEKNETSYIAFIAYIIVYPFGTKHYTSFPSRSFSTAISPISTLHTNATQMCYTIITWLPTGRLIISLHNMQHCVEHKRQLVWLVCHAFLLPQSSGGPFLCSGNSSTF